MSNELMKIEFNKEQVELIKTQIAPKATDSELKLFLYQAQRTGLDPLARQIYAIHRKTKDHNGNYIERMSIQTSIDGFRVIAERSGDYAGQDEPIFNEDGEKLVSCKVTVYRFKGDQRYPAAVGVAYWDEYKQTDFKGNVSGLWAKMPHTMLSKVAEALALRKAYPQDLSGLYTGDEMGQADNRQQVSVDADFSDIPDEGDRQVLRDMVYKSTLDEETRIATLEKIENCTSYDQYKIYYAKLESVQSGFDDVANPNASDAKKIVRKIVGKKPVEA